MNTDNSFVKKYRRIEPEDISNASKYWEQFRKLPIGNAEMIMHLATYAKQAALNEDTVVPDNLEAEFYKTLKELETTDKLLDERQKVLDAIPLCPEHGGNCVPHAIEWIEKMKAKTDTVVEDKYSRMNYRGVEVQQPISPSPTDAPPNTGKGWEIKTVKNKTGFIYDANAFSYKKDTDEFNKWITQGELTINSVRRLSDNCVFTFQEETPNGKIHRFELDGNEMKVWFTDGVVAASFFLSEISKLPPKEPVLFTTEDGVGIKVNDVFWYVGDAWNVCETKLLFNGDNWNKRLKSFSTKEAAEQYILENKPCLSIKELRELTCLRIMDHDMKKIVARVKEKIV